MDSRVPASPGSVQIRRGRIYILPTRFGLGFALMAIAMLLGAINYSNSMAYALCFLLGSLALVCMHHSNNNLIHLVIRPLASEPVFAGQPARVAFELSNPSRLDRLSLALATTRSDPGAGIDIPAHSSRTLQLTLDTETRGWHAAGVMRLHSTAPLGLFYTWSLFRIDGAGVLVYPLPAPPTPIPPRGGQADGQTARSDAGEEEFSGLRSYRHGDALNRLHWKSLARGTAPMVKQFDSPAGHSAWLDWEQLPQYPPEQRLSILTRWVIDSEQAGKHYALRLPGTQIAASTGPQHYHRCLRALALFGKPAPIPESMA